LLVFLVNHPHLRDPDLVVDPQLFKGDRRTLRTSDPGLGRLNKERTAKAVRLTPGRPRDLGNHLCLAQRARNAVTLLSQVAAR
jgi:hypothetical protein